MKQLIQVFLTLLLAAAASSTMGFSLIGPFKVTANGYVNDWQIQAVGFQLPGDIGGTMEPMEGYRWNIPTITYAYDRSFYAYFGSNGINSVEAAIATLNSLPPASQITNDSGNLYIGGQPVPFNAKRINYRAEALGIVDVKTVALRYFLEEMGLAEPERWCFAIRGRQTIPAGVQYSVRKQNFDPITLMPTNRVNEATYSYAVLEPLQPGNYADALEFPVDPVAVNFSSIAGFNDGDTFVLPPTAGVFFEGLSHDDVGGLRWLFNPNNLAVEVLPPNTFVAGGGGGGGGGGSTINSPWTPITVITNLPGLTNFPGGSNIVGGGTSGVLTNDLATVPLVRPGVNKVTFHQVVFDNLLGNTFTPVTVRWTDRYFSGGRIVSQNVQRTITEPDIVFSAGDTGLGVVFPTVIGRTVTAGWTNMATFNGGSLGALGGPGIIMPPIEIRFNDQWPAYFNFIPNPLPGLDPEPPPGPFTQLWLYGSFDGSTNPPVIYPQYGNLTIADIQAYLRQVTPVP